MNDTIPGGFFVDGTHVKYGLPMATSITMLAWALLEFPDSFTQAQRGDMVNNIK
jgi:endoglucanase